MIEKLDFYRFCHDGISDLRFDTLVWKVNELIEAVNRLEKQVEKLQCDD